jgi:hypothetical protein
MTEAVEQEARALGWVPQEDFRGDVSRWVDAETFVERGHSVMPILKATNKQLEAQVSRLTGETQRLTQLFQASQESLEDLKNSYGEITKQAVAKAKRDLMEGMKRAREDGDVESELQIADELADLREGERAAAVAAKTPGKAAGAPAQDELHPDFKSWASENSWFGNDQRKTLRAMGIAQELRADESNDGLVGRPFFDKIMAVMEERTGGGQVTSKVSGSRPSGGGSGRAGKGYADLPAEAKAACDSQAKRLVGEGRAFKTEADWRANYAATYFAGEQA